jgi:hypothetical protein
MAAIDATRSVGDTRIVWAVDRSDPDLRRYRAAVAKSRRSQTTVLAVTGGTMVGALNEAVLTAVADTSVEAVAFLADDTHPRTDGWDAAFLSALREPGVGIVYPDDLFSSDFMPTHIAMRASIIRELGWMAHPNLKHLYVDTLWKDLGAASGCIRYLKHQDPARTVIIEHMHYQVGKSVEDDGYRRVNAPALYAEDEAAFRALHASGEVVRAAEVIRRLSGGPT